MGWLRLGGSLKVWVSLAEYRLFCRAVWQKRTRIERSLLIVATPYCFTLLNLLYWIYSIGFALLDLCHMKSEAS